MDKTILVERLLAVLRDAIQKELYSSNQFVGKQYALSLIEALAGVLMPNMENEDDIKAHLQERIEQRKELAKRIVEEMKKMKLPIRTAKKIPTKKPRSLSEHRMKELPEPKSKKKKKRSSSYRCFPL